MTAKMFDVLWVRDDGKTGATYVRAENKLRAGNFFTKRFNKQGRKILDIKECPKIR